MLSGAFDKTRAIFVRDARVALAYPSTFWGNWVGIAGQVVTFYFIAKLVGASRFYGVAGHPLTYFDYVAINLAFLRFQSVAIHSFQQAMRSQQMIGTLEVLLATPTSLPLMILASGLWAFVLTILQIAFFLAIAICFGLHLNHVNIVTALVFLGLTAVAMSPLGVLSAASIMTFKQEAPTSLLFGGFGALLSGVFFPIDKLPHAMKAIAWLIPITHSLNGIRGASAGASLSDLAPDAWWLAVMTVVLGPIALYAFSRAVRRAKVDGTLGDY
jgi:ABC-2 type transport system permease protein